MNYSGSLFEFAGNEIIDVEVKKTNYCKIHIFSDNHSMSIETDIKYFNKLIKEIKKQIREKKE